MTGPGRTPLAMLATSSAGVVIALVVTPNGLPLAYEVLPVP
jgi:hypothetical protein